MPARPLGRSGASGERGGRRRRALQVAVGRVHVRAQRAQLTAQEGGPATSGRPSESPAQSPRSSRGPSISSIGGSASCSTGCSVAGERLRRAQLVGAATREPTDARREVIAKLSQLAEALLRDGESGATRDMLRRVTSTLDALASFARLAHAPSAGRPGGRRRPPGFDAVAGFAAPCRSRNRRRNRSRRHCVGPNSRLPRSRATTASASGLLAAASAAVRDAARALERCSQARPSAPLTESDAAAARAKTLGRSVRSSKAGSSTSRRKRLPRPPDVRVRRLPGQADATRAARRRRAARSSWRAPRRSAALDRQGVERDRTFSFALAGPSHTIATKRNRGPNNGGRFEPTTASSRSTSIARPIT